MTQTLQPNTTRNQNPTKGKPSYTTKTIEHFEFNFHTDRFIVGLDLIQNIKTLVTPGIKQGGNIK
jgi:nicotinic acid mononucleotide adenylyltransferase